MTQEEITVLFAQVANDIAKENFTAAELLCRKILGMPESSQESTDEEHLSKLMSLPASRQNAVALRMLSESFWRRRMAVEALPLAKAGLAIAVELGNHPEQATSLTNVAIVYAHLSDYVHALEYYEKALAIEEALGNKYRIACNLGYLGLLYFELTDYPRALEYMQKSIAIEEELGDEDGIAASLQNIGMVYSNLTDYSRALECFGKALEINEKNEKIYG